MSERATCEACKWWEKARPGAQIDGLCRKYAPRPSAINNGQWHNGDWPATCERDWCGEHQPKPPHR